jgi:chaperonin GroES
MATAAKTKVKIRPLGNNVVVQPLEEEEEMRGGLYIPDTAKEKPQQGTVVAVGPGKLNDDGERLPMELEEGDRVIYGKYSGNEVEIAGEEYLLVAEDSVYGVVEE